MEIGILTYLVTGVIFIDITIIKVISMISESSEERERFDALIEAKNSLSSQISWKICAYLYAPITLATSLLLMIIGGIFSMFRK